MTAATSLENSWERLDFDLENDVEKLRVAFVRVTAVLGVQGDGGGGDDVWW